MSVQYFKNLFDDLNVASISPTSKFGIRRMLRKMDFEKAKVIVEYGPGGGVITRPLLKRMRKDAILILIETNDNFADSIEENIKDPRIKLFRESAENILEILKKCGVEYADYILSGIPFSLFDVPKKDRILKATKEALGEEGTFIVYQFLISAGKPKYDIRKKLNEHLHIVDREYEFRNIPPIRIYYSVNGRQARMFKSQQQSD